MSNIEEQVVEWRRGVMEKPRRGITRTEYIQQFLDMIRPRMYPQAVDLTGWKIRHGIHKGPGQYLWVDGHWSAIRAGDRWGGEGLTGFFKTTFTVPDSFQGQAFMLDLFVGGDGILRVDGKDWAGLECFHREIFLDKRAKAGRTYELEMEICVDHQVTPGPEHTFHYARAVTVDKEIQSFYWDFQAAFLAANNEFAQADTAAYLLEALETAMLLCDPYESNAKEFMLGLRRARASLKKAIEKAPAGAEGELAILGHSHLDLVYLWDYKEFQRKILRTHATQLMLMREYPEWKFSQSQAIIYREMKELYPDVYAGIKRRVKDGRWEPLGGMFLEPDCNTISGESLVRQFLFGQRFFEQEFGERCRVGWLPDVFGLPASMPQIMKGCGIDYFYTAKLVWNDTNEWNTHLFWWESPDGSRILTHTPPLHFIGTCEAPHIMKAAQMLEPKSEVQKGLYTYGWGDGGGGVEQRMIFVADRYRAMPGVPALKHQSALEYFEEQNKQVRDTLPEWKSELYLETHRGTYTTAALLKKYNRQSERRLRELEIWSCVSTLRGGTYDQESLNQIWELVLINQFHDILPGSHITKGFTDAVEDYARAFQLMDQVKSQVGRSLASGTRRKDGPVEVCNSLLWDRPATLLLETEGAEGACLSDGTALPAQVVEKDGARALLVQMPDVPSCGARMVKLSAANAAPVSEELSVSKTLLENRFLRVKLDANGEIKSLYDKTEEREYIEEGQTGNRYQLFEDKPGKYDAWDIARVYEKRRWDVTKADSIEILENGPVRVVVEVCKHFSKSRIRQRYLLEAGARWLDAEVWIDWHEDFRLLKLAFPLNVHADKASYHVPYGTIERAARNPDRWDEAKFEAAAQMWADLSEKTHGLSLINDCKYGYDIRENVMRLTLLKAPKYPNPESDRHEHSFSFRLYPHPQGWREAGTWALAQSFNTPVTLLPAKVDAEAMASMLAWEGSSLLQLEAWKQAEDSPDFVIRLREVYGQPAKGRLLTGFRMDKVSEANMLEQPTKKLRTAKQHIDLELTPNQALTLLVKPER